MMTLLYIIVGCTIGAILFYYVMHILSKAITTALLKVLDYVRAIKVEVKK